MVLDTNVISQIHVSTTTVSKHFWTNVFLTQNSTQCHTCTFHIGKKLSHKSISSPLSPHTPPPPPPPPSSSSPPSHPTVPHQTVSVGNRAKELTCMWIFSVYTNILQTWKYTQTHTMHAWPHAHLQDVHKHACIHTHKHMHICTHGCVQAQLVADSNQTIHSSKVIDHGDPHWTRQTAAYTQACFITFKNNPYNPTDVDRDPTHSMLQVPTIHHQKQTRHTCQPNSNDF